MEVRAFLLEHPPFDALADEDLDRVVASVEIEHFAPGTVILQQAGAAATHLFVVRKGEVEILDDARVIDLVGEGEVFGMWSLLGRRADGLGPRGGGHALLSDRRGRRERGASHRRGDRVRRRERSSPRCARGRCADADIDPARYHDVGAIVRRPPGHVRALDSGGRRGGAHGARADLEPPDPDAGRRGRDPDRPGPPLSGRGRAAGGDTPVARS